MIAAAQDAIAASGGGADFAPALIAAIKGSGVKGKKLFLSMRAIFTGRLAGPELDQALPLIGFEKCAKRVEAARARCSA